MNDPMSAAIRVSRQLSHPPKPQIRIGRASGGLIPDDPTQPYTGPLHSEVAGRTDQINTHVPSGSYVIPADIVSSVGEGNSLAGLKVLSRMFSASPRNAPESPWLASGGPRGSSLPSGHMGGGEGIPSAPAPAGTGLNVPSLAKGMEAPQVAGLVKPPEQLPTGDAALAHGGKANKAPVGSPVPVVVAGGEFIVHPEDVARIGGGNIEHGHAILDAFVKQQRQKTIKTLQRLPGPAKR